MGIEDSVELVAVVTTDQCAVFESHGSEGRRTAMAITCTPEELNGFNKVLNLRPWGAQAPHRVWLRFLKQGNGLACGLRVSSIGSRQEVQMPVSEQTYAGLAFVLNQFALDPELVPEMPASVLDVSANHSFKRPPDGAA